RIDFATKHGVTPAQYARMTPQERAANDRAWEKASKPRQQGDGREINKYGYSNRQWRRMTPQQRHRAIRDFNETTRPRNETKPKREPRLTREQLERSRSQISQAADLFMNPPRVDKSIGQTLGLDPSRAGSRLTAR